MRLSDYPRPPDDTGIGIHWSPGFAIAVGMGAIREKWVPELKAMGVKWVKISNHEGAEGLSEYLLANGIMPIVRLHRFPLNPGQLTVGQMQGMMRHLSVGVKYFECNNEPNLGYEWAGGEIPNGAPDTVIDNWIKDAELILNNGGLPGTPALSPRNAKDTGDYWNWLLKLAQRRRLDILEAGGWIAIHNYWSNHPIDYPYDPVNQRAQPITPEEYNRAGGPGVFQNARSIEELNDFRMRTKNPGATINDDYNCFLEFQYWDGQAQKYLGHSLPVLTTEGGLVVGDIQDARYPRINPWIHADWTAAASKYMLDEAPDYYFCNCPWLLANIELGSPDGKWENAAWYSSYWAEKYNTGSELPVVNALKQLPKRPRRKPSDTPSTGAGPTPITVPVTAGPARSSTLVGRVNGGAGRRLVLSDANGTFSTTAIVNADGSYRFDQLPAGTFTVRVDGSDIKYEGIVSDGQTALAVNLDLQGDGSQDRTATGQQVGVWRVNASHNAADAAKALNGNAASNWCSGTRQQPAMWFVVDLGQSMGISHVKANNPPNTAPRGFVIQVSADGQNWQPVVRRDDNWLPIDETFAPVTARYVDITLTASARYIPWCISNIEIQ